MKHGKLTLGAIGVEKAVFTSEPIKKDEVLIEFTGELTNKPDKYTIQLGEDVHITCVSLTIYLNHSCEPNTYIDVATKSIRALVDIEQDKEVTFNYLATEYDMESPFACFCNAPTCLRQIRGFKHMSESERENIRHLAAPHLWTLVAKEKEHTHNHNHAAADVVAVTSV